MAKKVNKKTTSAVTILDESPWHAKSLLVYVAAMVIAADTILQAFVLKDVWGTATSVLLTVFLWIESYARIFRHRTYLGKTFAPIFSAIIIALILSDWMIYE